MGCRTKGRKPTRAQKIILNNKGLNVHNWLVLSEDNESIHIFNKLTGKSRRILKSV